MPPLNCTHLSFLFVKVLLDRMQDLELLGENGAYIFYLNVYFQTVHQVSE